MRADQSLIRKVDYTMALTDDFAANLEVIKGVKIATVRSYELLGAKIAAISTKLDAALADDASTAEERAALAAISSSLSTEAASLMETVVANTPAQFTAFQQQEFARWKKVIEVRKITAD